ncbi:uncharacterized protein LOC110380474 [Helicoverpa armigera]|uniref:uncharacterized protein LOC110380474 n=1 Tax=Helicoverpa armigera TaxID=29058 RepID=UPI0030838906
MSNLVIFFLAVIAISGPLNVAKSASAQGLDINTILELVQQQRINSGANRLNRVQLVQQSSDSSDDDTDSDDETESDEPENRYGRSNDEKLLEIIETLVNENRYKEGRNDYGPKKNRKPKYRATNSVYRSDKRDNSQNYAQVRTQNILDKLFGNNLNVAEKETKPTGDYEKKRLTPNLLLPRADDNYNRNDDVTGLEDYSKVYIVLNPNAVRQSKNQNALNDLISKVLSLSGSASKRDRSVNIKPRRLKGLVVNDQVVRRSRSSREIYAPRDDSNGDEYKSKKSRGNSNAGHTAIPYVRNRGDIYEKTHQS